MFKGEAIPEKDPLFSPHRLTSYPYLSTYIRTWLILRYALCLPASGWLYAPCEYSYIPQPVESLKVERGGTKTRNVAPFGFAQGHESIDIAQDREFVERPVEWEMAS